MSYQVTVSRTFLLWSTILTVNYNQGSSTWGKTLGRFPKINKWPSFRCRKHRKPTEVSHFQAKMGDYGIFAAPKEQQRKILNKNAQQWAKNCIYGHFDLRYPVSIIQIWFMAQPRPPLPSRWYLMIMHQLYRKHYLWA